MTGAGDSSHSSGIAPVYNSGIPCPNVRVQRKDTCIVHPEYFTLKMLAAYSSSSIRWLRARLTDSTNPLPHYRIEGKILVRRGDFDQWLAAHRVEGRAHNLDVFVDSLVAQVQPPPQRRP